MKRFLLFIVPILLIIVACSSTGGTQTQTIDIAYPNADVVTINLNTTAGQVTVNPADVAGVHGTLSTNVGAWQATTSSDASSISVTQGSASAEVIPDAQNSWDLQFGKGKALILNYTNTNANTTLSLGGLLLSQVNVRATNGDYNVRYASANPASDGGTATFQLTNGDLDASGLVNSHWSGLAITTQGGNMRLSFDGSPLTQNMTVLIDTQAGNLLLKIPPSIPAQVIYRSSSGALLEIDPQYKKVNDITYTMGDYSTTPHLSVEFRSVVGDLRLVGA